ncbi:MAG: NAD-dependent epimerase/dehydratase family protein [Christensenellales bacterium]
MILVTGARGHIGGALVKLLHDKGYGSLRVTANGPARHIEQYAKEIVKCDVRDGKAVDDAVRGCSDVFHMAGLISMSPRDGGILRDINVGGARNIIRSCKTHGVRRLVYVSSVHALPENRSIITENNIYNNLCGKKDAYGQTKYIATLEMLAEKDIDIVVVYPTGVIGPYDYRSSMSGIMFKKYMRESGRQPYFDGQFDFIDVRDTADGIYRAWKYGGKGEGYILAGEQCGIKKMIEQIALNANVRCRLTRVPVLLVKACAKFAPLFYNITGKTPVITTDTVSVMLSGVKIYCEKARAEIGFSPRPIEDTIRDTVKWYKSMENGGAESV